MAVLSFDTTRPENVRRKVAGTLYSLAIPSAVLMIDSFAFEDERSSTAPSPLRAPSTPAGKTPGPGERIRPRSEVLVFRTRAPPEDGWSSRAPATIARILSHSLRVHPS